MLFLETRFEALQIDRLPRLSAFRTGPEILDRPRDRLLELTSRAQGPIRIAQKLARHDHRIRLSRPNDVLRLNRGSYHPDGARHDSGLAPDAFGENRLVTGADRNSRMRNVPA